MNDLEQHFKKAAEQIRMTDSEKSAMRFNIQQETTPPTSPKLRGTSSPYVWMFAPRSLAMLSVALLVVFSTGSAYASEGSLPGSPLYPVKTKIVEPLKVALAPTVQAKAQANAQIASVRVQEAQTLAAKGTLTPKVVQEISENYNAHAKAALALAANIDAEHGTDDENDAATSNQDTAINITVAVNTPSTEPAVMATMMAEPVEPPSDDGVVSITATAPATLSISIQATSSKTSEVATSSTSNTRSAKTFVASTTRATAPQAPTASIQATTTETTRKDKSRNFVRTLRASLSAQAEILQKLEAGVRVNNERKGDN